MGATVFYVSNTTQNPFSEPLVQGKAEIGNANQTFQDLNQQYGPQIQAQCQGWTGTAVLNDLQTIGVEIDKSLDLVSFANINPYYDKIVRSDMCGTVIDGLGWLSLV